MRDLPALPLTASVLLACLLASSATLVALPQTAGSARPSVPARPSASTPPAAPPQVPLVRVDRDDVTIARDARVRIVSSPIPDRDGDGVIHITGEGITVTFEEAPLAGAARRTRPDSLRGIGIRVTGRDVRVRGAVIEGYKVGLLAEGADGLVVEGCRVVGGFRQHLGSLPDAEDPDDWLWPHENDHGEWVERYGAAFCVRDASEVTLRDLHVRKTQNGILLERVTASRVYGNDCSFLSGWGLAMWRSSDNLIVRNAFDFCVRGYSHGVYNRGQDSAGILMFEQCSRNLVRENSATHGGDGVFGFAGRQALGEDVPADQRPLPEEELGWYAGRGNTGNRFIANDLSYAAAHGLEMTFSTGNRIVDNRMAGNAICGIWGGYSRQTTIRGNRFEDNGEMPYGRERGGVNIEHGQHNVIVENVFRENAVGVRLFERPNEDLQQLPWARANGTDSRENIIARNTFIGDTAGIELEATEQTVVWGNEMREVGTPRAGDEISAATLREEPAPFPERVPRVSLDSLTTRDPVGARPGLAGREHIVITPWGPYDWEGPYLEPWRMRGGTHTYRLLGVEGGFAGAVWELEGAVTGSVDGGHLFVHPERTGAVTDYALRVSTGEKVLTARDLFVSADWTVRFFPWLTDPREDEEAWHREAARQGVTVHMDELVLPFASRGPSGLGISEELAASDLPADRFGTVAITQLRLEAGRWELRTTSDDGIRVWLDGQMVIDDWTWHAAREHRHSFRLSAPREVELRVEHFELDGYATLTVRLVPR